MLAVPAADGVSHARELPLWSLSTEQDDVLLQAESCTPLLAFQPIVAPATGVTPSAATTRTLTGYGACAPTGVDGFRALIRRMLSVAAAPKVRTLLMVVEPPVAASVMAMLCGPSV